MADLSWYGAPEGVDVGTVFATRQEAMSARVHRVLQAGIVGSRDNGAESIVVSGGYEDDEDYGDVIIYTGHGGNDRSTGRQIKDQSFDTYGNAALVTSVLTGAPVRVVRGRSRHSPTAPTAGYRYDGLYRAEHWWSETGKSGFKVCRFRLVSTAVDYAMPPALSVSSMNPEMHPAMHPAIIVSTPAGTAVPVRVSTVVQRVVRSGAVVEYVKKLHDHTCQMCCTRLSILGRGYSEGAHIRAIGRPHDGPDTTDNVLCLCPNCHVMFDNGAITVTDDFLVQRDDVNDSPLRLVAKHEIDPRFLAYHRAIHR
jgi:putative restriction endonuclease